MKLKHEVCQWFSRVCLYWCFSKLFPLTPGTGPNLQFCTVQRDFVLPSGKSAFLSCPVNTNLLLTCVAAQAVTISTFIFCLLFVLYWSHLITVKGTENFFEKSLSFQKCILTILFSFIMYCVHLPTGGYEF